MAVRIAPVLPSGERFVFYPSIRSVTQSCDGRIYNNVTLFLTRCVAFGIVNELSIKRRHFVLNQLPQLYRTSKVFALN